MSLALGDRAPDLTLPDTDGRVHELPSPGDAPATVVVWTCNHCPYALAWHDRLQAVVGDYAGEGVRFFSVNSNDAVRYPHDSLAAMADRVAAGHFGDPYLHDADQAAAHAYGAERTPDVYVFDRDLGLAYRGAPDPDWDDSSHDANWLRGALDAVLAGERPEPAETEPVGCTIKWRP